MSVRHLVTMTAMALVIAACSSDGDSDSTATEPSDTASGNSVVAETTASPEASSAPTTSGVVAADDGSAGAEADDVATVMTATGEITVPVTTAGIVTLDEWAAQMLVALGIQPETTANYFADAATLDVLADAGVGVIEPQNAELVAAERPAMIIGTGQPPHLELEPVLSEVAPVVLPDLELASWEEQLRVMAAVTGTTDRAEEIISKVDARIGQLADDVASSPVAGSTMSIVVDFGPGEFFALEQPVLGAEIVDRLGLQRPPDQQNDDPSDFGYIALSDELVPSQGADIIISLTGDFTQGLSALDNQLLPDAPTEADVDATVWSVSTPLSAWWILDDLESILLGDGTTRDTADALEVWTALTGA